MKRLLLIFTIHCCFAGVASAQVGIGTTTPHSSAELEINSTSKGLLPPRMTQAQRNAIVNPSPGLIIFNATTLNLEVFTGAGWAGIQFDLPVVKKLLGGTDGDIIYTLRNTSDGGFIAGGVSNSVNTGTLTGTAGYGIEDGWIIKLDAAGATQWQRLLGGNIFDFINDIQQTTDGGYIAVGYSASSSNTGTLTGITANGSIDGWVVKLDAGGNVQWQHLLGGDNRDYITRVIQVTDGYVLCGETLSSNSGSLTGITGNGAFDGWIVKLDKTGDVVWQRLLGGINDDFFYGIQPTAGGYIVMGYSNSSNTGTLTGIINNGEYDALVISLNTSGDLLWQIMLGGSGSEYMQSMSSTTDGGCILLGRTSSSNSGTLTGHNNNGNYDTWVIKLAASGSMQWQKLFGGNDIDQPSFIDQTADGGYIVTGVASSSNTGTLAGIINQGQYDGWFMKLDASGSLQWQKLLGGIGTENILAAVQTADGGYAIAGFTFLSAGSGLFAGFTAFGLQDSFIFKLDRYGNVR